MLPEREISLLLAESLAGGANYWVPFFPSDLSQPELRVVASYNALIKRNPEAFSNTRSMAKVALLWPAASVEFYEGSSVPLTDFTREIEATRVGDIGQEFLGFYEGLARAQVPFDVIDERNFPDLHRYQLLVMPNAACLSAESCRTIIDYVRDGGNLVASFETSLYDEKGRKEGDFRLAQLFGVRFSGRIFGPMHWDYVAPKLKPRAPLLKGITREFIPAPTYGVETQCVTGACLASFCTKLAGPYDHAPEVSPVPFLVTSEFGRGKVVYLAGTFGISLSNFRFPEYLTLVRNMTAWLSRTPVVMRGAPWVEVSARRNDEAVFVHLVNQTSGLKRPLTHIQGVTDLEVILPWTKCRGARALRSNKRLKTRTGRRGTSFTIPLLGDYEVVELPIVK
jgi:type 1 glutamine amidotransferase